MKFEFSDQAISGYYHMRGCVINFVDLNIFLKKILKMNQLNFPVAICLTWEPIRSNLKMKQVLMRPVAK